MYVSLSFFFYLNITFYFIFSSYRLFLIQSFKSLSFKCFLRSLAFNVIMCVVQLLSCVRLFVTPWIAACQTLLSSTVSQTLLKLMSIELLMLYICVCLCVCVFTLLSHFLFCCMT